MTSTPDKLSPESPAQAAPGQDAAAIVAEIQGRAQRHETPCGEGSIVWHRWGSGSPLVLAHGAGGSWSHWIRNIDALAQRHSVWALDLPGYGDSSPPPEPSHAAISAAIAQGLQTLPGLDAPVDFAGFSFGGVAGAHLAARYPGLVRRLVLVGTGGLDTPKGTIDLRGVKGLDEAGRRAVNRANLLQLMLAHESSVDELALYLQAANGRRSRFNPVELVLPDKLLLALPGVRAPVAMIWGELDRPHPDPAVQEVAARRVVPDLRFVTVPDAGHWVMYERPDAFNRILLQLLAESADG